MAYLLGFDPGGVRAFGWCLCRWQGSDELVVTASGTAGHARGAFDAALASLPRGERPAGAGIDAPLFWTVGTPRVVDEVVRSAIKARGAPSPGGTVQHFNSLRGACLIQGLMVARLLRETFPKLPITEAHPKALLWLLRVASSARLPIDIKAEDLPQVVRDPTAKTLGEHERDAVLAAMAALAMLRESSGWQDLAEKERQAIFAVDPPVGYWMPIG